jgi:hypothetical protein
VEKGVVLVLGGLGLAVGSLAVYEYYKTQKLGQTAHGSVYTAMTADGKIVTASTYDQAINLAGGVWISGQFYPGAYVLPHTFLGKLDGKPRPHSIDVNGHYVVVGTNHYFAISDNKAHAELVVQNPSLYQTEYNG